MAGHKPPSRLRYEREHPVVSARLTSEEHRRLIGMLQQSGISFGAWVRSKLHEEAPPLWHAYRAGWTRGVSDAFTWISEELRKVAQELAQDPGRRMKSVNAYEVMTDLAREFGKGDYVEKARLHMTKLGWGNPPRPFNHPRRAQRRDTAKTQ